MKTHGMSADSRGSRGRWVIALALLGLLAGSLTATAPPLYAEPPHAAPPARDGRAHGEAGHDSHSHGSEARGSTPAGEAPHEETDEHESHKTQFYYREFFNEPWRSMESDTIIKGRAWHLATLNLALIAILSALGFKRRRRALRNLQKRRTQP